MVHTELPIILVDSHVHIHRCYRWSIFFGSVLANFSYYAAKLAPGRAFQGVLLLGDPVDGCCFSRLWRSAGNNRSLEDDWTLLPADETSSLYVKNKQGDGFFIIAGRQIVTREGLELLALCCNESFRDGIPLRQGIETVRTGGGLPVIPWGFGKWMGQRGRILTRLLEETGSGDFFLGDNSGRPWFLPPPFHFALAGKRGITILPGSDPLPLKSEQTRAGSFGFSLCGRLSHGNPARDLAQMLNDPHVAINPYGRLERCFPFLGHQLVMQLRKRKKLKS